MDPEQIPLKDLQLPVGISWWPLAPGWWILGFILLGLFIYSILILYNNWRGNKARRLALKRLSKIHDNFEQGDDYQEIIQSLSSLLRRTMLAYAPRLEMAGLTGVKWLEWLDLGLEDRPFTEGIGKNLISLPYAEVNAENAQINIKELIEVVDRRIRIPLPKEKE